ALDFIQCDKAHLYNILHAFGFFMKIFKELELTYFDQTQLYINFIHMGAWLSYYYKAWFNTDPNCLLRELELYKQQKYLFKILRAHKKKVDSNYIQPNNSSSTLLLSDTSTSPASISTVPILTVSIPTAFTSTAFTPTASTLTASILIASAPTASTPIASTPIASFLFMKKEITLEANFDTVINKWEELLIDEEFEEETDDLDIEIDFFDFETHPAENQAAKWNLHDLFSHNLPFPIDSI
ncbi:11025_t:CDS:2, partial [Dentiscutata erythropus]